MKRGISTILCFMSSFYFCVAFVGSFDLINLLIGVAFLIISIAYWVRSDND